MQEPDPRPRSPLLAVAPKPGRTGSRSATAPAQNSALEQVDARDLEPLLAGLRAARAGDSGVRMRNTRPGIVGELYAAFNELAERREETTAELARVSTSARRFPPPPARGRRRSTRSTS